MWTCLVTSMALPCLLESPCLLHKLHLLWPLVRILRDCLAARPLTGLLHSFSLINHIHSWSSQPICNDHFTSLTCSHTSHVDQPPFWNSRQDEDKPVPLLQSTVFSQHIGHLPRQEPHLLKAPLHFFSFAIYPPESRVWWSLSSLKNTGIQTQNIFFWKTMK